MNAVVPFAFEDKLVRTVRIEDEPWFAGKDVCSVLDIRDHKQALGRLDEDERGGCSVPTPQGPQEMIVVSEAGVYRLIFTSRKIGRAHV
jgi:prophage antirepressor-like protein